MSHAYFMNIVINDRPCDAVVNLLSQHHADMLLHSPIESVHAFDFSTLQVTGVTFFSAWIDGELAGCGGLKVLDATHGEIKSMRTSEAFLRKGVAREILSSILKTACERSYKTVSLETGTNEVFIPAQKLYRIFGFSVCKPFADYVADPHSIFMSKSLNTQRT